MAASSTIDVSQITGQFDLSLIKRLNMYFLFKEVSVSVEREINFCMEVGLLPKLRKCSYCKKPLKLVKEPRADHATPVVYRCHNRGCKKCQSYVSIRDGTLFDGSKLSIGTTLKLLVLFAGGCTSYESLRHECVDDCDTELSQETISDWLTYFREIQLEALVRHSSGKIGGENCVVEVDESKFGRRKYNRGRVVEGQWVVGGICRETGEIFIAMCPENKRDAATLLQIIDDHVWENSTIITDCWKAYEGLDESKWRHLTVNHSQNFVDPSSGAHTQSIENTWWQLKRNLPSTHAGRGGNLMLHFAQYLWQRKFDISISGAAWKLIEHAAELYSGKK